VSWLVRFTSHLALMPGRPIVQGGMQWCVLPCSTSSEALIDCMYCAGSACPGSQLQSQKPADSVGPAPPPHSRTLMLMLPPSYPGILTALTQPSPAALRTAIRETRTLTSKPFGVNITLLPSINPPDYEGYARAAVAEGVRIFETAGNNRECCTWAGACGLGEGC
jgi:hypothetical protein